MAHAQLRVYVGPEQDQDAALAPAAKTVTVRLGEILPLLADAHTSRRTWLSDFNREAVQISADLYEVLLAYQHYRRPSA
jgi:hypothetical protein